MARIKKCDFFGSAVLGMHDAVVSITGTIAGLTFTLTNRRLILLTCIIMSVVDALSMTAANYLATKTDNMRRAATAGFITGIAYIVGTIYDFYKCKTCFYWHNTDNNCNIIWI
ncbi:MAG: VIT1/CCC1 transporter family protein [Proteobacteria bacterium]|nr:VIT1/CCC1 transporter family protein [Candidatus Enterousia onthequi]